MGPGKPDGISKGILNPELQNIEYSKYLRKQVLLGTSCH
jgi:hypothetical protein